MPLLVSDYPREQYAGHFEFVDSRGVAEAEYAGLAGGIAAGLPEALERGAAIQRALKELPEGAITARVYPVGGEPMEFTGPAGEAEAFVTDAMAALKKGA